MFADVQNELSDQDVRQIWHDLAPGVGLAPDDLGDAREMLGDLIRTEKVASDRNTRLSKGLNLLVAVNSTLLFGLSHMGQTPMVRWLAFANVGFMTWLLKQPFEYTNALQASDLSRYPFAFEMTKSICMSERGTLEELRLKHLISILDRGLYLHNFHIDPLAIDHPTYGNPYVLNQRTSLFLVAAGFLALGAASLIFSPSYLATSLMFLAVPYLSLLPEFLYSPFPRHGQAQAAVSAVPMSAETHKKMMTWVERKGSDFEFAKRYQAKEILRVLYQNDLLKSHWRGNAKTTALLSVSAGLASQFLFSSSALFIDQAWCVRTLLVAAIQLFLSVSRYSLFEPKADEIGLDNVVKHSLKYPRAQHLKVLSQLAMTSVYQQEWTQKEQFIFLAVRTFWHPILSVVGCGFGRCVYNITHGISEAMSVEVGSARWLTEVASSTLARPLVFLSVHEESLIEKAENSFGLPAPPTHQVTPL